MVVKRSLDLVLLMLSSPVWLPVTGVVGAAVMLRLGRPVLFRQLRAGLHGQPFQVLKFRTMTDARDAAGELLPDAERLTPFGTWLRSTSLDELPELFNVLGGSMSLVGPRPLLLRYVERYNPEQRRRLEVPPGLTGWAQINGRNSLSWEERFHLDVWYVEQRSVWLDLKILWWTVWKVLRREGINAAGESTMSEFMGDPSGTDRPRGDSPATSRPGTNWT